MPAGPFEIYHNALLKMEKGSVTWDSNANLKCMMLVEAYTPNLATDEFVAGIVANEVASGGDYARQVVATPVSALVAGKSQNDCADWSFGASVTISGKYLVIFEDTGNDATAPVLYVCDMETSGGEVGSTNGAFNVVVSGNGIHETTPNTV